MNTLLHRQVPDHLYWRLKAIANSTRRSMNQQAIATVACDQELADAAAAAFQSFSRGRHPSALNFGQGFSYALAHRLPLLFVGNDLRRTDFEAPL